MKQFLTGADLFSHVLLLKSATRRAVLLVEGSSDSRALSSHINSSDVCIVVGSGKSSVLQAIDIVNERSVKKVVGLVDSDLGAQLGGSIESPNLVTTERYDLEADIFFLPGVAGRIASNFANIATLESYFADSGDESAHSSDTAVATVIDISSYVGQVRLESYVNKLEFNVRDLPYDSLLDDGGSHVDLDKLAQVIKSRSSGTQLNLPEVEQLLVEIYARHTASEILCCGHDLIAVMGAAMRRWWGARVANNTLENTVRAMLACRDFTQMRVHKVLASWGEQFSVKFWACKTQS